MDEVEQGVCMVLASVFCAAKIANGGAIGNGNYERDACNDAEKLVAEFKRRGWKLPTNG